MKDGRMEDNRMVKDDHQQGIERKLQRKSEYRCVDGHQGKMGHSMRSDAGFKRTGATMTPRKA
jgi:hypothetical protein